MKELSIEDKAKRYDEAIIKFKPIYDLAKEQGRTIDVKEFENIFPELKKFEDDDIKKWLIGYFNQYIIDGMPQVFGNGLNVKDVIEWLEKQGEQKSIEWSGKIGSKYAKGKLKEMLDRKEKPAWSEEDERCWSIIIAEFSKCAGKSVSKDEWMRCNDWLNSLRDRVQPKQEWSEEDKERISMLLDLVGSKEESMEVKLELVIFLKSLKNRMFPKTWKPSEDQISVLSRSLKYINTISQNYYHVLGELLAQLKKLREG